MKERCPLILLYRRSRPESGFTLLEYCAGAVVMLTIVYVAMRGMGDSLATFLTAIGDWAKGQGTSISALP